MVIVMEIQVGETVSTIVESYADPFQAESKFHQILTAAAVSSVPKHSAVILNDEGQMMKHECYIHEG